MIVGIILSKRLADKYGKRNVFGIVLIYFYFVHYCILFLSLTVGGLMFASQILHGFFYGITIPLLWAMIADVADYSEWKNNRRATAIIFSAMMVGLKGGLTIGGALLTWLLGLFNYVPNSDAVQTASGNTRHQNAGKHFSFHSFFNWCGLLFFYEINKKMEVQIETDLKERSKTCY